MKILLAEDSDALRTLVALILRDMEEVTEVIEAHDGLVTLGRLAENPDVALLVLDLKMPIMDGWDVLDRLYRHETNPQILVMTASADEDLADKLSALGVNHFLKKPFSPYTLRTKVKELLKK